MTGEELKRLAKLPRQSHVRHWLNNVAWRDEIFASIVSSLLAPWTAVPVGDEYVLVRMSRDAADNPFAEYWCPNGPQTFHATRFASPLHAAEALHQEKQPTDSLRREGATQ